MNNPKPKNTKSQNQFTETETRDNILEELPIGICRSDLKGTINYVNKYLEEVTGYTRDEIVGRNALKLGLFPDDTRSYILKRIAARIGGAPSKKWDIQVKCKKRSWIWVTLEGTIIRKSGIPVGFQITASDITERKQAEEALIVERNKLMQVIDGLSTVGIGVDIIDTNYRIFYQNRFLKDQFNDLKNELCYEKYMNLKEPCSFCPMVKAIKENRSIRAEMIGANGNIYELLSAPLPDADGTVNKVIEIIRDITERKQAEETLKSLSSIVEQSTEGMALADMNGNLTFVNKAWCEMHGYKSSKSLVGKNLAVFHNKEQLKNDVNPSNEELIKHGSYSGEVGHITKNGKIFPTLMTTSIIKDLQGVPVALAGVAKNITERKQAEEALKKSEFGFRTVWENSASGMRITDENSIIMNVNDAFCNMFGKSKEELEGQSLAVIYSSEEKERIQLKHHERFHLRTVATHFEKELKLWNGKRIWVHVTNSFLDLEGEKSLLLGLFTDITERKRAEEALRESEKRYQLLFEQARDSIMLFELPPAGIPIIRDANTTALQTLGFSYDELIGQPISMISAEEDFVSLTAERNRLTKITGDAIFEVRHRRKDGSVFYVEASAKELTVSGKLLSLIIERDITDRKQAEEALQESEAKYRLMVESSRDGIVISQNNKFIFLNDAFASLLGYQKEELFLSDYTTVFSEKAISLLEERGRQGLKGETVPDQYETVFKKKDGTEVPVEASIRVIDYKGQKATFAIIRDISKQKEIMAAMQASAEQSNGFKSHIPICAGCNKIRDEEQESHPWVSPAVYINDRLPNVHFSHGMCPDCMEKWYPGFVDNKLSEIQKTP